MDGDGVSHTHEEIICIGNVTAHAEELHQIVKLAVDVAAYLAGTHTSQTPSPNRDPPNLPRWIMATYCYRRVNRDDVPLLDEQLPGLVTELANFGLGYRSACSQLGDRPGEEEANVSTSWSDQKVSERIGELTCRGRS